MVGKKIALRQDAINKLLTFTIDGKDSTGLLIQKLELSLDAECNIPFLKLTLVPGQLDLAIEKFGLVVDEAKCQHEGVTKVLVLNDGDVRYFHPDGTPVKPVPPACFQVPPDPATSDPATSDPKE
jgi:hypothetical protein